MTDNQPSPSPKSSGLAAFWQELKRRHVVRVGTVYAVVGWLVIQIAATTFEGFDIPVWAFRFVMLMVVLGFPISVVLAWAFELTPEGIKTTKSAQKEIRLLENTAGHAEVSESHAKKRNWFSLVFAAAVPTLIFGTLAVFFFFRSGSDSSSLDTPASSLQFEDLEKSIAVLPLTNMSPDPNNAFFADGVQEDILTNLSKIDDLLVISRSSTLQYRNPDRNLKQIGIELGVRYLVEGSVRRVEDQVLVTAQLIDTHTDGHLWAENYDRSLDNIFAIQAEIATEIAGQLRAVLTPETIAQIERRPTDNLEAYDNYVRARHLIEFYGVERQEEKIALLDKAVSLDPDFAEAWAQIVVECLFWWDTGKNRQDPSLLEKADLALREAKRSGPGLPHIPLAEHVVALRKHRDQSAAIKHLQDALEIDPHFLLAHTRLGIRLEAAGRLDESLPHLELVERTDPLSGIATVVLEKVYQVLGQWDDVYKLIKKNMDRYDEGWDEWNGSMWSAKFRETGDKQALLQSMSTFSGFAQNPTFQASHALVERDYEKARMHLSDVTRPDFTILEPQDLFSPGLRLYPGLLNALLLFEENQFEKEHPDFENQRKLIEELIEANPFGDPVRWSQLAIFYALEGNFDLMNEMIDQARELADMDFWVYNHKVHCEIHIAIAYLILGENDSAIETLEAASKMDGPIILNRELDLWFMFDQLRGNPRFDKLLEN